MPDDRAELKTLCECVCRCGPNGEPLACGYPKGHDGAHSWATLPTFAKPPARLGGTAATMRDNGHFIVVEARPEWWSAVLSSLGRDYPGTDGIRQAIEVSAERRRG